MNNTRILLVAGRERQTGVPKYRSPWAVGARERVLGEGGGSAPFRMGQVRKKTTEGQASRLIGEKHHPLKGRAWRSIHSFMGQVQSSKRAWSGVIYTMTHHGFPPDMCPIPSPHPTHHMGP